MILAISIAVAVSAAPTPTPMSIAFPSPQPFSTARASATPAPPPPGTILTPDQQQKVDAIALHALADQASAGLALAIVRQGRVAYSRGYGYSSVELQQTTRDASLFEVGAITKEFTGAAVMSLVADGKLSLDDTLARWMPAFPRAKDITVRQLIDMTSGIASYSDLPDFDSRVQSAVTPSQIVDLVKAMPLDFEPGTQWEYSNTNYVLLGMIVEQVAGSDFGTYLDSQLFTKQGMTASLYGDVGASSPDLTTGYAFDGQAFKPDAPWNLDWGYAADGAVSNVLDLAQWDTALLGAKVVSLPALHQMWTPVRLKSGASVPWGFGWTIESMDGHREVDSNGGLPGYAGRNAMFPNDGFDVVVLSNTNDFDAGPVVRQIFELFYPPTAAAAAADRVGDDAVFGRARDIFRALQSGTLSANDLTPFAGKRLTPKLLSQAKSQLGPLGRPTKFVEVDKYLSGDETAYVYDLTFKQAMLGFSVSLDAAGKVGSISVRPL